MKNHPLTKLLEPFIILLGFDVLIYGVIKFFIMGGFDSCGSSPQSMECVLGGSSRGGIVDDMSECIISCEFVTKNELLLESTLILTLVILTSAILYYLHKKREKSE